MALESPTVVRFASLHAPARNWSNPNCGNTVSYVAGSVTFPSCWCLRTLATRLVVAEHTAEDE